MSKRLKWSWDWLNTKTFSLNECIYWVTLTYSLSGAFYWMKQLFTINASSWMDVIFLVNIFRLYLKVKSKFCHNCTRKKLFLSACYFWDGTISLRVMGQKFFPGGKIGYGYSYLDSLFRYSKVIRLHAILHHAAEAVQLQTDKGSGYCYTIGRGPNCCLLGHVTGLFFSLYVKIFLPSIFNLVDFWNGITLIVLDIGLTGKTIFKELGPFIDGPLQGLSFCPTKTFKPNKQTTWNTSHLHGIAWSNGKLE